MGINWKGWEMEVKNFTKTFHGERDWALMDT